MFPRKSVSLFRPTSAKTRLLPNRIVGDSTYTHAYPLIVSLLTTRILFAPSLLHRLLVPSQPDSGCIGDKSTRTPRRFSGNHSTILLLPSIAYPFGIHCCSFAHLQRCTFATRIGHRAAQDGRHCCQPNCRIASNFGGFSSVDPTL